ncbi:MAG: hypothetical protein PHS44_04730 [Candidatus Dojkabacteria bacterium]|nr:hypothetical protein [Candidatus Dojkabacteria bacterium]
MIRSSIGISKIPVSNEVDPGFGPDTEQRRVEFAAKMENEAFSIAVGDATKIAKANLITALKLWDREKLIPGVRKLELREIMIIWLIFELSYLAQIWNDLDVDGKKAITDSETTLSEFIKKIFSALSQNIPHRIFKIDLDLKFIHSVRECFGGDLIFSLKQKNDLEVVKVYEMTYSKLPKSLRETFYYIVTGVEFLYLDLIRYLNSKTDSLLESLVMHVHNCIRSEDEYKIEEVQLKIMSSIVECFDKEASEHILKLNQSISDQSKKEVDDKVRKYYGLE